MLHDIQQLALHAYDVLLELNVEDLERNSQRALVALGVVRGGRKHACCAILAAKMTKVIEYIRRIPPNQSFHVRMCRIPDSRQVLWLFAEIAANGNLSHAKVSATHC